MPDCIVPGLPHPQSWKHRALEDIQRDREQAIQAEQRLRQEHEQLAAAQLQALEAMKARR